MKKYILSLITFLMLLPISVSAGSANVSISTPSSVYVGDKVKISVTISSTGGYMAGWEFNILYDDSLLACDSNSINQSGASCGHVASAASSSEQNSVTYTWNMTAKKAGVASFSVSAIDILDWNEGSINANIPAKKSIEINKPNPVSGGGSNNNGGGNTTKPSTGYKYSENNNLSSLNVEGFEFEFDKNKTDYSITVPNDTRSVKIGATAEDGKARVNGIGDFEVKEGDNLIEVVVTAENGDKKTYKLNIVVEEATPIEVKVGDDTYSVVRKADLLPNALATFEASTTLIKGEEVPCYHSNITDFYLLGLRDKDGEIDLYRYDAKEDKFYVYNQLQIGGIYIALLDGEVPSGYKLDKVKINDKEYSAFIKDGAYPLLYGINLESGEKNYYSYDSNEGTIQKLLKNASTSILNEKSAFIIYGLIGLCIFEFIVLIAFVSSKNKKLKKALRNKMSTKTEYEKSLSNDIEESDISNNDYEDSTEEFENTSDDIDTDDSIEKNDDSNVDETKKEIDHVSDERFGYTAYVADSVSNVFNSSKKEKKISKKKKKSDDDEMFQF